MQQIKGNQMKKIFFTGLLVISLMGCEKNNYFYDSDTTPPSPPTGVYASARDNKVLIDWRYNPERDVAGYKVWWSYSYRGPYRYLGRTSNNFFDDLGAINGKTYYYAVSAYDFDGNESQLSRDEAFATPRPEGYGVILYDYRTNPNRSGYDFSTYSVGNYNDEYTDIFFEYYNGTYYMNVWNDTDIKDMGPTNSLYEIEVAPSSNWSPTKDVVLAVGRTYVVWTYDDHYAKFRVVALSPTRVVFDWAYQLQKGNPYLKRNFNNEKRLLTLGAGANSRK